MKMHAVVSFASLGAVVAFAGAALPGCGGEDAKVIVVLKETLSKVKSAEASKDDFEVGAQCLAAASTLDQAEVKTAVAAGGEAKTLADELAALCKAAEGGAPGTAAGGAGLPPVDDGEGTAAPASGGPGTAAGGSAAPATAAGASGAPATSIPTSAAPSAAPATGATSAAPASAK
jgi:hypothetical protein